jgi:hypothetical protein
MAWESRTKIGNLPLVSTGLVARGFIAIGCIGFGFINISFFGLGVISIAQFGIGVVCLAQFGLGFVTIAQGGAGIFFAYGQAVLGFIASGEMAGGYYSVQSMNLAGNIEKLYEQVASDPLALMLWMIGWMAIIILLQSRWRAIEGSAPDLIKRIMRLVRGS